MKTVKAHVNATNFLKHAGDFFKSTSWPKEIYQNSLRAGATRIETILNGKTLTFTDNGSGIENLQSLLDLLDSSWNDQIKRNQAPAGMGVASYLYQFHTTIESKGEKIRTTPEALREAKEIPIEKSDFKEGTRITLHFNKENENTLQEWATKQYYLLHMEHVCLACFNKNKEKVHHKVVLNGDVIIHSVLTDIPEWCSSQYARSIFPQETYPIKVLQIQNGKIKQDEVLLPTPTIHKKTEEGELFLQISAEESATPIINYNGYQALDLSRLIPEIPEPKIPLESSLGKHYKIGGFIHNMDVIDLSKPDRCHILKNQKLEAFIRDYIEPLIKTHTENIKRVSILKTDWKNESRIPPLLQENVVVADSYQGTGIGPELTEHSKIGHFDPEGKLLLDGPILTENNSYYDTFDYFIPWVFQHSCESLRFASRDIKGNEIFMGPHEVSRSLLNLHKKRKIKVGILPIPHEQINLLKDHPIIGPKVRNPTEDFKISFEITSEKSYGEDKNFLNLLETDQWELKDLKTGRTFTIDDEIVLAPGKRFRKEIEKDYDYNTLHYFNRGPFEPVLITKKWREKKEMTALEKAEKIFSLWEIEYDEEQAEANETYENATDKLEYEAIASIFEVLPNILPKAIKETLKRELLRSTQGELDHIREYTDHTFHVKKFHMEGDTLEALLTYQDPRVTVQGKYKDGQWKTRITKRKAKELC